MPNDATKVSVGKPNVIGAVFNAPIGSTLPTDASTALDAAFVGLGYLSDAGWVASPNATEGTEIKAYGGDVVLKTDATTAWTFKFAFIQTDKKALEVYFGKDNVVETDGKLKVSVANTPRGANAYVFNLVETGNKPVRIVVPNGKVTAIEDISYTDTDVISYGVTISALPDVSGKQYYEYIDPAPES
jgi:hypothetical protein